MDTASSSLKELSNKGLELKLTKDRSPEQEIEYQKILREIDERTEVFGETNISKYRKLIDKLKENRKHWQFQ